MSSLETVDNFVALFKGRTDAYGSWSGGMVKAEPVDPTGHADFLVDHLYDGPYIGVYPTTDDNLVGWGCIDIDGKDFPVNDDGYPPCDWTLMWQIVSELQDVLYYKDCDSWIERTANGIHLWVFAEQRLPAETMRHALLVACQVAEYKPKEVNPKQLHVSADKRYGNYVRLPYYGALKGGAPKDRFIVDADGVPMTVGNFSRAAMGSRVPVGTLEHMATLYAPPETKHSSVLPDAATEEAFEMLRPILPPVVEMMTTYGPKGDRSAALVRAAVILKDDGWQAQAVFTVLRALDRLVFRKFADRIDPDGPLLDIMAKVGL